MVEEVVSMTGSGPIPDDASVVRCGQPPYTAGPRPLFRSCAPHEGVYGFSVQGAPGAVVEDLAAWCRNNKIGWMTAGALRSFGYDVITTPGPGHHATVIAPGDWQSSDAESLGSRFQERENPVPKARRF